MRMRCRERAPVALAVLVVAAAGVAACRGDAPPPPQATSRAAFDIRLSPETTLVRDLVPRSTTLERLLTGHGVQADAVPQVVEAVRAVFDPRRLRSLQPFIIERTLWGALRRFEYEIDGASKLRVTAADHAPGTVRAEVLPIPRVLEHGTIAGTIDAATGSLYAAMKAAGEGDELVARLAAVFSGEIDFNSEVQLDDRFVVSFERYRREDGGAATYGEITSAEYRPATGRVLRAIYFAPAGGRGDYYDDQGRSLRRFFLKSPLKFEPRITSGFSSRRMHPVLHTARAHRGVDYGAPTGSPVVAVADGPVVSVTSDSTNGRMVRLRHAGGYQTYYLHLSRFGAGVHAGRRVGQGDVIGYVGSTGLATGPHLHYGLTKNGVFVNPVAEHRRMPPGEPIPASAMDAFAVVRDREMARLAAADAAPEPQTAMMSSPETALP